MSGKRRWPDSPAPIQDSDGCFRCGFEFSSDPATREEEIGHQAINGSLCYSCTINSTTATPSRFSVRAAHDFRVIRFENTVWDTGEHQPVSTPRAVDTLADIEWEAVEAIATRSLEHEFTAVSRDSLTEEKVKAATVFESSMEETGELLRLPGVAIIGMDTVFIQSGSVETVKQRLSDPRAEAEQTGLAQY